MKNYIQKIREKIGHDKFIHPAARIIIENDKEEFLAIERVDNGKLGIPAGALEENETIEACIRREVKEETNLELINLEVIGISSNPINESVVYPNGDKIQYFTVEFFSNKWDGELKVNDEYEVQKVMFVTKDTATKLPKNELSVFESLAYFRETKKVLLK